MSRTEIRKALRISFAKVTEYQARGVVHFHGLIRLDGPSGPEDDPPAWADASVLRQAAESAAATARVGVPWAEEIGERTVAFGSQMVVREVTISGGELGADAAASYLAKYVTKGTEDAHGVDWRIRTREDIGLTVTTLHVREQMYACWDIGGLPVFRDFGLRRWCHTLGFGGHVASKSGTYSVTFKELRKVRADFRASDGLDSDHMDGRNIVVETRMHFAGRGWQHAALADHAQGVAEERQQARELAHANRPALPLAGEAA